MSITHNKLESIESFEVKSDVTKSAEAILEIMDVARSHGVKSWLCYGALLGMIRENRLLPWNNDAELACWHDADTDKKFRDITDSLNKRGFRTFYYSTNGALNVCGSEGVVVNLNAYWRQGIYAVRPHETPSEFGYTPFVSQLFYWSAVFMAAYTTPRPGSFRSSLTIKKKVKELFVSILRHIPLGIRRELIFLCFKASRKFGGTFQKTGIPKIYFESCSFIDFYGGKVLVPDLSEELLEFIYGHEWRTPKDKWSFYHNENKSVTGIKFIDEIWSYRSMDII